MSDNEHVHEWSRGESRMWANRDAVWLCDCGAVAFGDNPPRPSSGLTLEADAFRRGAEAMREAAAKACEAEVVHWDGQSNASNRPEAEEAAECANAIRALPLPEPPK